MGPPERARRNRSGDGGPAADAPRLWVEHNVGLELAGLLSEARRQADITQPLRPFCALALAAAAVPAAIRDAVADLWRRTPARGPQDPRALATWLGSVL